MAFVAFSMLRILGAVYRIAFPFVAKFPLPAARAVGERISRISSDSKNI